MDPLFGALIYLPALAYLGVVSTLLAIDARVATWVHPTMLAVGCTARLIQSGPIDTLTSLGIAVAAFVLLVGLAGRTVSGVTLFALVVTVAVLPTTGLPYLLVGLGLAAATALVRTWRYLGKGRVAWLTLDTMNAMGVSSSGGIKRPEVGLVPDREALTDIHTDSADAAKLRMFVPPYLLVGVAIAAALTVHS